MSRVLCFEKEQANFCCGLTEIGEFRVEEADDYNYSYYQSDTDEKWEPNPDQGYIATTKRTQTGTIKRLKRLGFKKLGTWTRDSGVKLTLWGYFPRRKRRKK